jgi:16S rRNA (guanine966-N2)-methyltransferase
VRIISGTLKGILIEAPKGLPVRPTTDRAKESLFNILENKLDIEQLEVLDLFSGTGNISYEFVSRGAAKVTAVDNQVIKKDAFQFIKSSENKYDLIFADAPYAHPQLIQIPELVYKHQLLKPGGLLIVEHESLLSFKQHQGFTEERVYGQSTFSFFQLLG